jgi:NitT/TauT family transport system permease protein
MLMSVTTQTSKGAPLKVRQYVYTWKGTRSFSERANTSPAASSASGIERLLTVVPPLMLAGLLLLSWYLSTAPGGIPSIIIPAPGDVFASLFSGISSGIYLSNTWVTLQESLLGFLFALAIALPLGYGLAKSQLLATAVQPYLSAGQAIPALVIIPLLQIWLGYGLLPNIVICMLVVLFPMVMNTILGVQTIDTTLTDAARVEGAAGWSLLSQIEFPLALPAILTSIRTGFTLSIMGAIVGEFVGGGDQGLGALVVQAKNSYNIPFMFATLIVLAALALLCYSATWALVKLAERIYY